MGNMDITVFGVLEIMLLVYFPDDSTKCTKTYVSLMFLRL